MLDMLGIPLEGLPQQRTQHNALGSSPEERVSHTLRCCRPLALNCFNHSADEMQCCGDIGQCTQILLVVANFDEIVVKRMPASREDVVQQASSHEHVTTLGIPAPQITVSAMSGEQAANG